MSDRTDALIAKTKELAYEIEEANHLSDLQIAIVNSLLAFPLTNDALGRIDDIINE